MTNPLYGEPPSLSPTSVKKANLMYHTADAAVGQPHGHNGGRSNLGPTIGTRDANGGASADFTDGLWYDTVERTVTTTAETETGGGGGHGYITVTSDDNVYAVPTNPLPSGVAIAPVPGDLLAPL